ncbi:MAG TPA: hypothetical protein VFE58_00585 [Tepidisphaeraceae bacterium]|jgi:hypothetical protein|nr:hypothetical protein [Tepidisphaeraceae bacterium]
MVIEHTFITTLDSSTALQSAAQLCQQHGFVTAGESAFPMTGPEWTDLKMARGVKNPRRAKSISQLPQILRLQFDRGRINLAISLQPGGPWGGGSFYTEGKPTSKRMRLHRELLTSIALSLESLLANRAPLDQATTQWSQIETEIARLARRRKIRQRIILAIVLLLVLAAVVLPMLITVYHLSR